MGAPLPMVLETNRANELWGLATLIITETTTTIVMIIMPEIQMRCQLLNLLFIALNPFKNKFLGKEKIWKQIILIQQNQ